MSSTETTPPPAVLAEIVRRVVEVANPDRIILFGSAARGDMGADSDIDLLIVKSGVPHRRRLAQQIYANLFGVPVPVDIVVVTPEDIVRSAGKVSTILTAVLAGGRSMSAELRDPPDPREWLHRARCWGAHGSRPTPRRRERRGRPRAAASESSSARLDVPPRGPARLACSSAAPIESHLEARGHVRLRRLAVLVASVFGAAGLASAQQLEIHYINVGWGSSVFVKGPDGTTVLMEAGNNGKGTGRVVPYLQSIGIQPADGLDFTIVGHQHCDHVGGMDEVVQAGYDVRGANYYNGVAGSTSCVADWEAAAGGTSAGVPQAMPLGHEIPLGNGAKLTAVAVNGSVLGGDWVAVVDENDRSIAVLVQFGGFDYLWASDLGGGDDDNACTGRSTSQLDVETHVIQAISPGGGAPLISAGGIDVLNVNHHGSESSTNANWMNLSQPAVAIIATGAGQSSNWNFPRMDVLENVLHASAACITVPAAFVLQTEEGSPTGPLTSFAGFSVGNIKIATDGQSTFAASADGQVSQGPNEVVAAGLPRTFALDDAPPADLIFRDGFQTP